MSQVAKYDYSAVDAYFDRLNEVHRHRANRFRLENIRSMLPNAALLVVSIGLACLLAFIGYSQIVNPRPIKVVEIPKSYPEIIRERMPKNDINGEKVPPREPGTIVKNYVIFTFVSVDSVVGVSTVITGKQYKIEGEIFPESQWCYIDKPLTGNVIGSAKKSFTLSKVDEKGIKTNNINRSLSEHASISVSNLMKLEKKCVLETRFRNKVI